MTREISALFPTATTFDEAPARTQQGQNYPPQNVYMSQHARIEEVSDSDLESDPSEQDLEDFAPISLARPPSAPTSTSTTPSQHEFAQFQAAASAAQRAASSPANELKIKKYQCLYPLYFDANRSRAQGRRVGKEFAVRNPLAREIVDAVQLLGLDTVFEPGKTHPKDWSNPGRVRVLVKENGSARNRAVQNSRLFFFSFFSFFPPLSKLCYYRTPLPLSSPLLKPFCYSINLCALTGLPPPLYPYLKPPAPEAYRTPPLHPRLQAPPRQPYKPRIPSSPTYPGYTPPRTPPPNPGHPSRLENEYRAAAPLARAERWRG